MKFVHVVRVYLLEEQLRETEVNTAKLLAEEQRRSREIIVCSFAVCFSFESGYVQAHLYADGAGCVCWLALCLAL